jgi:flagellar motor switch protein FliM
MSQENEPSANPAPGAPEEPDLMAAVATLEAKEAAERAATMEKESIPAYDFRNPLLLSSRETRKLRQHQEGFLQSLASRLSLHLRMEFSLKLETVQTATQQKYAASWASPSHLSLFKLEPLRGIAVMEITPQLGFCMVDRLMGGSGRVPENAPPEMSEIERALLEQTGQLILEEWCDGWRKLKDLKPVILGYETNGRFVQTAPAETTLLLLTLEATMGECTGLIQIGVPFVGMEPLVRQLAKSAEVTAAPAPPPAAPAPTRWNKSFDDVKVNLTAEWHGLELTTREILALKLGDVLQLDPVLVQQMKVRVADQVKFNGRPGTVAGTWAVELTQTT